MRVSVCERQGVRECERVCERERGRESGGPGGLGDPEWMASFLLWDSYSCLNWGFRFEVWDSEFRVQALGFRVRFRV